ncbi:hypothetical protein C1O57_08550 [Akkermansia muciniphila]|nr:hypothetical protein C1O57_08550 [Akkermansia muciniphila]
MGGNFTAGRSGFFPGAVTGEMVAFTGEPDSAGCSWCWEQADRPNARAHARNKCFFITGFWRIYAHPAFLSRPKSSIRAA